MRYIHNVISASRLAATPLCALLAVFEATQMAALVVAILVALTDFVDGPLARRLGGASSFGALLDMTSDKVFLCTMMIVLAAVGKAPLWAAAIITARELVVLALRCIASSRNRPLPIATFGKLKTFLLYFLVPLALARDMADWSGGVANAVWFLAFAASLSAAVSLVEYVVKMRAELAAAFLGVSSAAGKP